MKSFFSFFWKDLKESLILSISSVLFVIYILVMVRFFPDFYGRIVLLSIVIFCLIFFFLPKNKGRKKK